MAYFMGLGLFGGDENISEDDDVTLYPDTLEVEQTSMDSSTSEGPGLRSDRRKTKYSKHQNKITPRLNSVINSTTSSSGYLGNMVNVDLLSNTMPLNVTERNVNERLRTPRVRTRLASSLSEGDFLSLPPEPQQGNVEYKLKLVNPSGQRLEHLITQMKWRLREGLGEAIYEIGVEDDGHMRGLSDADMFSSMETLSEMARRLGATIQVLRDRVEQTDEETRTVAEVLVRKVPDDRPCIDLRVCVLGSADVGKSTLLGVLTHGTLDNGRGRARLNMFRHLHEIRTGRTSSISHEILGFDSAGNDIHYGSCATTDEICENSTKLITFIDLAGHQKYLRTTISGLTGYSPHYALLVVSGSSGVMGMTHDHLRMIVALDVPFFIVMTKIDSISRRKQEHALDSMHQLLTSVGSNRVPLIIRSKDDCITAASNTLCENIVPIFCCSSVTGLGLDLLKQFLHLLPPGVGLKEREKLEQAKAEFQIDEVFDVPGIGTVAGGLLTRGVVTELMPLMLGPFNEPCLFRPVICCSIRRNRTAWRAVRATQSAALALNVPPGSIRKGMVLLEGPLNKTQYCCLRFRADICVLFHPTAIYKGFRTTVHVDNVRQTAVIQDIDPIKGVRSNDRAVVLFRFIRNPEFIKVGAAIFFTEGRTKGFGKVTEIIEIEDDVDQLASTRLNDVSEFSR